MIICRGLPILSLFAYALLCSGCAPAGRFGPLDGGTLETYSAAPAMTWPPSPGAGRYDVEISGEADFASSIVRDTTPIPRYIPANGLLPGDYWWRVKPQGSGDWLVVGRLRVLAPNHVFDVPANAGLQDIRDIIARASRHTPALVRFPERGQFRLAAEGELFALSGTGSLILDGRGSTITLTSPTAGLARLSHTREVSFKDFIIQHDPPPFTVGIIRGINFSTRELRLETAPGHPDFDAPHILEGWGVCAFLEPNIRGRLLDKAPLVPGLLKESLRRIPGGFSVQVAPSTPMDGLVPGVRVVQFARKGGSRPLFFAENSRDAAFLRIVNHTAAGGHYVLLESDGARILNCHSLPAPGHDFGANADGAHVRSAVVGPWIEGCSFDAVGDDGIALFAKGIEVLDQPNEKTVVLDEKFFNLAQGQEILFYNPRDGVPVGRRVRILSMESDSSGPGRIRIHLDAPLGGKLVYNFSEAWNNDQAFNLMARNQNFVIRRNSFRNIRRYGIIVRADRGAIEDNTFEGVSDSAITLQNEPNYWRNGLNSTGVTITGNRMRQCNFSASASGRGVIHIGLRAIADVTRQWGDVKLSPWRGHRDITITDNVIAEWRECAMSLQNIDGLVLEGNRILDQRPSLEGMAPARAIFLKNIREIRVDDNMMENLQPGTVKIVREP